MHLLVSAQLQRLCVSRTKHPASIAVLQEVKCTCAGLLYNVRAGPTAWQSAGPHPSHVLTFACITWHHANLGHAGPVPPFWGQNGTFNFRLFSLSNNFLTGSIPSSLATVAFSSAVFDISTNKLQGALGNAWYSIWTNGSTPRLTSFSVQ